MGKINLVVVFPKTKIKLMPRKHEYFLFTLQKLFKPTVF